MHIPAKQQVQNVMWVELKTPSMKRTLVPSSSMEQTWFLQPVRPLLPPKAPVVASCPQNPTHHRERTKSFDTEGTSSHTCLRLMMRRGAPFALTSSCGASVEFLLHGVTHRTAQIGRAVVKPLERAHGAVLSGLTGSLWMHPACGPRHIETPGQHSTSSLHFVTKAAGTHTMAPPDAANWKRDRFSFIWSTSVRSLRNSASRTSNSVLTWHAHGKMSATAQSTRLVAWPHLVVHHSPNKPQKITTQPLQLVLHVF